jgi:hypothetical protein
LNIQNQENNGDNVLAQDGGNGKGSGNSAAQGIGQSQSSNQNAQCVSGGDVSDSCNNLNIQNQENNGDNVLAQDGGNGKHGGNSAAQGIGQSQSSNQRSQCVAGGSLDNSCNNLSFQNQENSGGNAALQSGGNGKGSGNSAAQGIGQSQSSNQNAQCVSGEDAIVSCNNVEFQNQVNSGNNVLAQFGLDDNGNQGSARHGGSYGGNSAAQGISQSQDADQRSSVVTAGSSLLSGNNVNLQNQDNDGDNVAAQSGGSSGGNSAAQGISQSQDSDQRSSVVSADDSVASGNNINVQNQENEGNNAAAQSGGSDENQDNDDNSDAQSLAQSQDNGNEDNGDDGNNGDDNSSSDSESGDTESAQARSNDSSNGDDGDDGSSNGDEESSEE